MAIASNFPAIKPSLSLDFANTKKLDPRVTFTRTTTATYYDGVTTAMAEQNLILQSQDYSATWTVTNLTPVTGKTAPDSTSTATEFTAGAANAVLTQGYTAVAGSYTFSVWLRRVTGTGNIDIAADNGTWTTKVITGTWARYDVTQTVAAGSKTAGVRVVTSGDAIEVWGAQLEQRSSVTAYTATTTQPITNYIPVLLTAASGVARLDSNPTTDEPPELLIEEQRTNLLTYSADFSNAAWSKTRSSITANTIVAPDGTLTGDKLVEDTTASNTHYTAEAFSYTSGTAYSYSVYAKAAERIRVAILAFSVNSVFTSSTAVFNLSTGLITRQDAGFTSASITNVGNGWYRCSITITAAATASGQIGILLADTDTNVTYTGNGYAGVYIWGAQLEAGAFATSYIATTSATVTRNTDAASMTGSNFTSWYNQAEGTLYVEAAAGSFTTSPVYAMLHDGTSNNYIVLQNNTSGSGRSAGAVNGVSWTNAITANTASVNVSGRYASVYKVSDQAICLNNGTVATSTNGILPVVNQLKIGDWRTTGNSINGRIKKLAYYPLRLTNAQLQALTS
jgi:hypothetical protein